MVLGLPESNCRVNLTLSTCHLLTQSGWLADRVIENYYGQHMKNSAKNIGRILQYKYTTTYPSIHTTMFTSRRLEALASNIYGLKAQRLAEEKRKRLLATQEFNRYVGIVATVFLFVVLFALCAHYVK